MDKDEILRLKQITGLAALFKDVDFGQAWTPAVDEFELDEEEYLPTLDEEEAEDAEEDRVLLEV